MDPISIIVTALIAGAAAGGQEAVSAGVRDAYVAIRNRLSRDDGDAAAADEAARDRDVAALEVAVRRAGVADDAEVQALAQRLRETVPADAVTRAEHDVETARGIDLRHAQGVQINRDGGQGTQYNRFG